MTELNFFRKLIAVLKLSKSFKKRGEEVQAIITACLANTLVTWPAGLLSNMQAKLDLFIDAQAQMLTRTVGTKAIRDAAWDKVDVLVNKIKRTVQEAADANPLQAEQIITNSGMKVKKVSGRPKQKDEVRNGTNSGAVIIYGKIDKKSTSHEWEISSDGINFTMLPYTIGATTMVTGLTPGAKMYFRHRCVIKGVPGLWGPILDIVII
jgi:hypothetical protein